MSQQEKRFCVYANQNEVSDRIYVGQSDCLRRRLKEGNNGKLKSTRYETAFIKLPHLNREKEVPKMGIPLIVRRAAVVN